MPATAGSGSAPCSRTIRSAKRSLGPARSAASRSTRSATALRGWWSCCAGWCDDAPLEEDTRMIPAPQALARLKDGNRRFVAEIGGGDHLTAASRRTRLADGQEPFAIVLGCSDSRVPAELVFDQGLGDLFVIRVAGNIVAPSQIGSIEFAAERFHTRLVVVLGHSSCGAILATVEELGRRAEEQSPNLRSIVDRVRPSVEAVMGTSLAKDHDSLVHHAVRANIRMSVDQLRHGSEILENLIQEQGLLVVGAEYSLETGIVEFFDGIPDGA